MKPLQNLRTFGCWSCHNIFFQPTGGASLSGLSKSFRRQRKCIKSLLVCDPQASAFNSSNNIYHQQLKKALVSNVFKVGKWGTHRRFPAKAANKIKSEHLCYVKAILESSDWIVGSEVNLKPHEALVHVICFTTFVSLQFKYDIL